MSTCDETELLKTKIKTLEQALEKRKPKKSLKEILGGWAEESHDPAISVALLGKLINSSVDAVIAADMQGSLLIFNDAAATIFGYTVEEALAGLNIRQLYPDNGAHEIMAKLRSQAHGGAGKLAGGLVQVLDKQGNLIPVRMNASIVYEKDEEIATIGYLRDLRPPAGKGKSQAETHPDLPPADPDLSLDDYYCGVIHQMQLYDQQFCVGAIKHELVTISQVKQALRKQSEIVEKTKVRVPIGRIMVQLGILSETQRSAVVSLYRMHPTTPVNEAAGKERPLVEDVTILEISEDRLTATVHVEARHAGEVEPADLLRFIEEEGIVCNRADAGQLEAYLQAASANGPLVVARGKTPVAPKPPGVRCLFDDDPLGVGTAREDGSIDWKNRGKLPQFKAGDLLAEIVPGEAGISGIDVFGKEIEPPAVRADLPKCGKGVALSEDGSHYLARQNGMAALEENRIVLIETLVVEGDVGLETGHIDFDGHVEINGSIHQGYRVSCKSLRAQEVYEAEVTISGDMAVMGGIYDSLVKCKGGLQAIQIRKSQVRTGGDLFVQKEIMESTIETSGALRIDDGTIIASQVSARDGVSAGNLGRKGASASSLVVGIDQRAKRKIKYVKHSLKLQSKEVDRLPLEIEKLEGKIEKLRAEKAEFTDNLACHMETIAKFKQAAGKKGADLDKMEKINENLNSERERLESHLRGTETDLEKMTERASERNEDILNGQKEMERLSAQLEDLIAEGTTHQQGAVVQVTGGAYAGTTIAGPNSSLTFDEDLSRLVVREVKMAEEDGSESTVMQMAPLG